MYSAYIIKLILIIYISASATVIVQDFYWRDYIPGTIPYDALQVDNKRYIGQIIHMGNFVPATIYGHTDVAIGEMGGAQIINSNIKIFCTPDVSRFYWENVDFTKPYDLQMKNSVKGGSQWNYDLYIGKTLHEGELKIGKVIPMDNPEFNGLYIWNKERNSMKLTNFYILKYNTTIVTEDGAIIQNIYWRDYIHGDIPCDAYEGAPGRYIGQVNYKEFNLVATIYTNNGSAVTTLFGVQNTKKDIKILCSPDNSKFYWEKVDFDKPLDKQLQNAVKGGFQEQHNSLFIGKELFEGEWRIGKVHGYENGGSKGLWIWNNRRTETNLHQFFILKYNIAAACQRPCNIYV